MYVVDARHNIGLRRLWSSDVDRRNPGLPTACSHQILESRFAMIPTTEGPMVTVWPSLTLGAFR